MVLADLTLLVPAAAALAAIAGVVVAYLVARQRIRHEREMAEIDSARLLLDEAASTMARTDSLLESVGSRLHTYASPLPGSLWDKDLLRRDAATVKIAHDEMTSMTERLRLRLGPGHGLATVYESASSFTSAVAFDLELMASEASSRGEALDDPHERIDRVIALFKNARDMFVQFAYETVGTTLPIGSLGARA